MVLQGRKSPIGYHETVIGLRIVFGQVAASLRHRALRHSLTASGVVLGSAFYSAVASYRHAMVTVGGASEATAELMWFSYVSLAMMLAGLSNSMLIAVGERFREIGTLKCLGASDATVLSMTLLECALLALIGSIVGVSFGIAAGAKLAGSAPYWADAPLHLVTSLAVCIASSIVPAVAAARIPAAAALRSEV